ncbi:hypothetical protein GCM10025867_35130 [Frondihabitans sucicola]|uniref:Trehalase-like N-terminal domain-containing protein n=1 Tax=Frondihabitans sucicola TaxID=1268041 RepID=A0ABM8GS11_9MICO|nr:hypothetical protein GCM10025867_35130 [Frondihabitans sucicola]
MTTSLDSTTERTFRAPLPRVDGYVPLRSYAAIGDGRTIALIADDGQIDWLPMPEMDTEPVIAGLVDAGSGGRFELRPVADFEVDRSYLEGTNVLTTRFRTASGTVEITDALVTGVAGRLPGRSSCAGSRASTEPWISSGRSSPAARSGRSRCSGSTRCTGRCCERETSTWC